MKQSGHSLDTVAKDCQLWLKSKKARILKQHENSYFEARQGRAARYDIPWNPLKNIYLILTENESEITLMIKIIPFNYDMGKKLSSRWYHFYEDLVNRLGVSLSKLERKRIYHRSESKLTYMLAISYVTLLTILFSWIIFDLIYHPPSSVTDSQAILLILMFFGGGVLLTFDSWRFLIRSLVRYRDLYW